MYLTESKLRTYARTQTKSRRENLTLNEQQAQLTIFLSHSHADREVIEGTIAYLAQFGILLYVDWQDSSMPEVTNHVTANKIKQRIQALDLFILLATERALASRWVPWELGIADSLKQWEEIAIIPVKDDNGRWTGNEYIQIYQRIEEMANVPKLLLPTSLLTNRSFKERSGTTLSTYLQRKAHPRYWQSGSYRNYRNYP